MNPRFLLLCLLACAPSIRAQGSAVNDKTAPLRPLNLSVPRDVLRSEPPAFRDGEEDTATRNLRSNKDEGKPKTERLPYGIGYEARQQGAASAPGFGGMGGGMIGPGGPGGMGGASPGGQGGMGRGR